jgi:N6-L-threonylcarbamoyladenine synthase
MRILAIETSCDDTGVAILEATGIFSHGRVRISRVTQSGTSERFSHAKLLADLVSSQTKVHAPWGGVVPMLAKREHQRNLLPLLKQALKETKLLKISKFYPERSQRAKFLNLKSILEREPVLQKRILPFLKKYQKPEIDLIAVTVGPGLEPALWVGVNFARVLAYFWNLPIIQVNHVRAHISANFIENKIGGVSNKLFPAVALIVSGGHTQLILIKVSGGTPSEGRPASPQLQRGERPDVCRDRVGVGARERGTPPDEKKDFIYEILGETRDDAAGEAFDKAAKMLNLGYPGGPVISQQAAKFNSQFPITKNPKNSKIQNTKYKIQIKLPRPMINSNDFDFSFSGLKTATLYLLQKMTKNQIKKLTPAICAEFQQAVIDVLIAKTIRAAKRYGAKSVILSGGVAANDLLRKNLSLATNYSSLNFLVPSKNYCTDNAAMIAYAAYLNLINKKQTEFKSWQKLQAQGNLRIK